MKSVTTSFETFVERPRKYPEGLPVRLSIRCAGCSHRCTIDSYVRNGFPSVFAAKIGAVFSTLCAVQGEVIDAPDGQQKVSSDVSE